MNKPLAKTVEEILEHINPKKPVEVYRNLHKGCLSVRQRGIVRCHTDRIMLTDVKFKVGKAGQLKVRETGHKNIHATVLGIVERDWNLSSTLIKNFWTSIYYNPYKCDQFQEVESGMSVFTAFKAHVEPCGIYALGPMFKPSR